MSGNIEQIQLATERELPPFIPHQISIECWVIWLGIWRDIMTQRPLKQKMTPLPYSPRMTFLMSCCFARGVITHLLSSGTTEHHDFIRRVVPERGRKRREGQRTMLRFWNHPHVSKWGKVKVSLYFCCRTVLGFFPSKLYIKESKRESQSLSPQMTQWSKNALLICWPTLACRGGQGTIAQKHVLCHCVPASLLACLHVSLYLLCWPLPNSPWLPTKKDHA